MSYSTLGWELKHLRGVHRTYGWSQLRLKTESECSKGSHCWLFWRQHTGRGLERWLGPRPTQSRPWPMLSICSVFLAPTGLLYESNVPGMRKRRAHTWKEWSQLGPKHQGFCSGNVGLDPKSTRKCWPVSRGKAPAQRGSGSNSPPPAPPPTRMIAPITHTGKTRLMLTSIQLFYRRYWAHTKCTEMLPIRTAFQDQKRQLFHVIS